MKILLLIAVAAAAWWFFNPRAPKLETPKPAAVGNAAERYASSLANDVKKAEAARDKMNSAIQKGKDTAEKALEEAH